MLGNADYYISVTDSEYDGYQDHSSGSGKGVAANFGYRFNPNLQTRFYFRYRATENDTPGRLTLQQIKHDPRAASALNLARDAKRPQPGATWLANKIRQQTDESAITWSADAR